MQEEIIKINRWVEKPDNEYTIYKIVEFYPERVNRRWRIQLFSISNTHCERISDMFHSEFELANILRNKGD